MEGTLAAIDIGTNSIHLLVARPTDANRFEIVDREKEVVRLGSGSGDMKRLEPDAIERGVEALKRFRQVADISGAEIHAVATSAVREAENRDEFIRRAATEAGIDVQVISGVEEARLIHLGVLQAVPVFDVQRLVVDIGGGSTELVIGRAGDVLAARSLKLGSIRLTERFLRREPLRRKDLDECRQFVRAYLRPVARDLLGRHRFDVAVGSSGTIVNVAEMVRAQRGDEPVRVLSNLSFTADELRGLVRELTRAKTVKDRLATPGLDPKRADIILGGAILLEQVFAELDIDAMTVSDYALREGVILDAIRRRGASLHHLRDLRYESVLHLASICPDEREHAEHATMLALQLFDATADLHGLGDAGREYLEAAGLLANVGLFISHARHHLHSYYIIRNSEHLQGYTDDEIEVIAQTARYHRKSAPKPDHEEFVRMPEDDQKVVRTLAGILRVGIALDRTHAGVVRGLHCDGDGKSIVVHVDTDGADASLEIYTAEARRGLFEDALGVTVQFDPGSSVVGADDDDSVAGAEGDGS